MAAVEYAIDHDDGQSTRALAKADVILVAPSRCGKTPTTMYLALQHGLFVANYPLVEEESTPRSCPARLAVCGSDASGSRPRRLVCARSGRSAAPTPGTRRSIKCSYERRRAEAMFAAHGVPVINTATKSVEEMSTVILQTVAGRP